MAGGLPDDIRKHIEAIASRDDRDLEQLEQRLSGGAWAAGEADRRLPAALGWLRRWRPSGPAPLAPLCDCASGRCLVCN